MNGGDAHAASDGLGTGRKKIDPMANRATSEAAAIEEIQEERPEGKITITGLDGTIYIGGDTHGMWTFIYDVYGNLWYERPAINNCISLPGPRVYIVKVGDMVRKIGLN